MSMNKQDFRLIASALSQSRPPVLRDEHEQWEHDVSTISNFLYSEFTNFDRAKFLCAAGIPSSQINQEIRNNATSFLRDNFANYNEATILNLMNLLGASK